MKEATGVHLSSQCQELKFLTFSILILVLNIQIKDKIYIISRILLTLLILVFSRPPSNEPSDAKSMKRRDLLSKILFEYGPFSNQSQKFKEILIFKNQYLTICKISCNFAYFQNFKAWVFNLP